MEICLPALSEVKLSQATREGGQGELGVGWVRLLCKRFGKFQKFQILPLKV